MAQTKRVVDWIREHLEQPAFLVAEPKQMPSLEELKQSEWCAEFEQLMRNRLVMGAFRYDTFEAKRTVNKGKWDVVPSIRSRLDKYVKTGNMEHLVDIANLCMVEFVSQAHPHAHFASIDDGEHVGRT
jgi:hypothetical protein